MELNLKNKVLPDVQKQRLQELNSHVVLDQVGMRHIQVPILLKKNDSIVFQTSAAASAIVNLIDPQARGIHMSRLFQELQVGLQSEVLSFLLLEKVLNQFLITHEKLSDYAEVRVDFNLLLQRKALKSENQAWRSYPVRLIAKQKRNQSCELQLETEVIYSSTCPASAALARNLIQENFKDKFANEELNFDKMTEFLGSTEGIVATPHAQRSLARVRIQIKPQTELPFSNLIDWIEDALKTPVQSFVKRVDEQEFALRNGQNLMFCEDAARRIFIALTKQESVTDFVAEVSHLESLHPHDAVCRVSKGLNLKGFE